MKTLAFCIALLLPASTMASEQQHLYHDLGTILDAVALNAGAAALTLYIGPFADAVDYTDADANTTGPRVIGFKTLTLDIAFDYTAVAGTITSTCTGGPTRTTATSRLTTCTMTTGTCGLNWSGVATTISLSGDDSWLVPMTIVGVPVIKCVIAHGGAAGATDKITVKGWLIAD